MHLPTDAPVNDCNESIILLHQPYQGKQDTKAVPKTQGHIYCRKCRSVHFALGVQKEREFINSSAETFTHKNLVKCTPQRE